MVKITAVSFQKYRVARIHEALTIGRIHDIH